MIAKPQQNSNQAFFGAADKKRKEKLHKIN